MNFLLVREPSITPQSGEVFTPGKLYANEVYFCETCEDEDRFLENDLDHIKEQKIHGRTAIPRGRYELVITFSPHFNKFLPELLAVPGFDKIRMHGGNRAEDSEGCILCGAVRTATGIAQCAATVGRIVAAISSDLQRGERSYIEVR